MILVHRLSGEPFFVNADLIEGIEPATPGIAPRGCILLLVDGRRATVRESPDQLVDEIRRFRASVLVAAEDMRNSAPSRPNLVLLQAPPDAAAGSPER